MTEELNKGSKYFANISKVIDSIKDIAKNKSSVHLEGEDKLNWQVINVLCSIVDTQNDILKYIISHDSKATILEDADRFAPSQFVWVERENSFGVIKEIIDSDFVKVHIIKLNEDIVLNKTEINE